MVMVQVMVVLGLELVLDLRGGLALGLLLGQGLVL